MSSKDPPGIPKNFRCPQDLLALIEKDCDREKKPFSKVVIKRLRFWYSEDWNCTGTRIRGINRELEILNHKKFILKKIRHKTVIARKEKKLEKKRLELEAAEMEEVKGVEQLTRDMNILRDHLDGRKELWVHIDDPMDFMYFDGEPNSNYRKLRRGQLNPELLKFYDENYHLLQ